MHFTREPIIETIISPKEGYKLVIRSSSGKGHEEFSADAVEVVSFGKSYFFRSIERPKAFLLPVSDYEVVEARETRVPLKKATAQKSIKIAGGKETEPKEEKKRRRSRRRKQEEEITPPPVAEEETPKESPAAPARFIEPPTSLISDQIRQYKDENPPAEEDLFTDQDIEETPPLPEDGPPTDVEEEVSQTPKGEGDFPF